MLGRRKVRVDVHDSPGRWDAADEWQRLDHLATLTTQIGFTSVVAAATLSAATGQSDVRLVLRVGAALAAIGALLAVLSLAQKMDFDADLSEVPKRHRRKRRFLGFGVAIVLIAVVAAGAVASFMATS